MTDRYYALTVILEKDIRDDDAQPILNAMKMIKGVSRVKPHIADADLYFNQCNVRSELIKKLYSVLTEGYEK